MISATEIQMNPITKRAEILAEYWSTYNSQSGVSEYSEKTFMEDALYGIGIAMSDDYKFRQGLDKFKEFLREYLENNPYNTDPTLTQ